MGGFYLRESTNQLISLKLKHGILMLFSMHGNGLRAEPASK